MNISDIISTSGLLCTVGKSIFGSTYSFLWSMITLLGFWKCFFIIAAIILWTSLEILAKGTHSYNSENGFTPVFNSFLGASGYFWLQTLVYFILEKLFSDAIYCLKWPYFLHTGVFLLTGFILHITGIWPYWKIFGGKIRIR